MTTNNTDKETKRQISDSQTRAHIKQVAKFINILRGMLMIRAEQHDASKLQDPESGTFAEYGPRLKKLIYGSDEYSQCLVEMKKALEHHYENNRHHPEHFDGGISDMDLVDLIEMFCDWKAATLRHNDGDMIQSIEHNAERFGMDSQLVAILKNSIELLGPSSAETHRLVEGE